MRAVPGSCLPKCKCLLFANAKIVHQIHKEQIVTVFDLVETLRHPFSQDFQDVAIVISLELPHRSLFPFFKSLEVITAANIGLSSAFKFGGAVQGGTTDDDQDTERDQVADFSFLGTTECSFRVVGQLPYEHGRTSLAWKDVIVNELRNTITLSLS